VLVGDLVEHIANIIEEVALGEDELVDLVAGAWVLPLVGGFA